VILIYEGFISFETQQMLHKCLLSSLIAFIVLYINNVFYCVQKRLRPFGVQWLHRPLQLCAVGSEPRIVYLVVTHVFLVSNIDYIKPCHISLKYKYMYNINACLNLAIPVCKLHFHALRIQHMSLKTRV
jgi:hypothetical protein